MKNSPLEEVEEKWCSLYLCSRLLGLIILTLCKCRAASEKFKFTPFPKIPRFLSKIAEFSDQKITPNQQLHQYFPVDFFSFLNDFFLSRRPTPSTVMYVVAVLRSFLGPLSCCFGFILILPASGLASEPELQSKTGEMVVKVFKARSKYLKGRLQNFDCIPLITPLKNIQTF